MKSKSRKQYLGVSILLATSMVQAAERALFEQEPHDRITLTKGNDSVVLKVIPLEFPNRQVPVPEERQKKAIRLHLIDQPHRTFSLEWRHIEKIDLYEHMVFQAAIRLTERAKELTVQNDFEGAAEAFDEAYWHFKILRDHYPAYRGVREQIEIYLRLNAASAYRAGRFDDSLALLVELRVWNPEKEGLNREITVLASKVIQSYVEAKDYAAARKFVDRIGKAEAAVRDQWVPQFEELARNELVVARRHLAAGEFRKAKFAVGNAEDIWPDFEDSQQLSREIAQQFSLVVVGVLQPANFQSLHRVDNWSSRRVGRLVQRRLVEFMGRGPEGGVYSCPWGTLSLSDDGKSLEFQLTENSTGESVNNLSAYDVARRLVNLADPSTALFDPLWGEITSGITVDGFQQVRVEFYRIHVRPQALLQISPVGAMSRGDAFDLASRPYDLAESDGKEARFFLNQDYAMREEKQPSEIIETYFENAADGLTALNRGQIDVLERIYPADLKRVGRMQGVEVVPYQTPSIHVLIPNYDRPYTANRTFRRALVYGIDRETILKHEILGNNDVEGCRVISGPFPSGSDASDPLGYAYDETIAPLPWDPQAAFTLKSAAVSHFEKIKERGGGDVPVLKPLVLAHPSGELPRVACEAIVQYLTFAGIECVRRELPPGETTDPEGAYDLLYAELVLSEPAIDAHQLLGPRGLIGGGSSFLQQALRGVSAARNWRQIRLELHRVHRIVKDESAVIPLWQIVEHAAVRTMLGGVGTNPVHLYQNVEQWQLIP